MNINTKKSTPMPNTEGLQSIAGDQIGLGTNGSSYTSRLSMSPVRFASLGHRALELAVDHLDQRGQLTVRRLLSHLDRSKIAARQLAANGEDEVEILGFRADCILPYALGNGHPRFFGWITSAPAPIGILADLLATTMNANCASGDHAAAELETTVCRWLMEMTGFPLEGSRGLLVSGGLVANLTALAVARHQAFAASGTDVRAEGVRAGGELVLYQSSEAHNCIRKAVEIMGLGSRSLRTIPVDEKLKMNPTMLAAAIAEDKRAGLRPFCVVATAGTVNSGAIHPLGAIANICEAEGQGSQPPTPILRIGSTRSGARIRSPSIHTNGCACRSNAAACWFATRRCSTPPSIRRRLICAGRTRVPLLQIPGPMSSDCSSPVGHVRSRPQRS